MNVRLVFLIFLVVIFAVGTGFMSFSQTSGIPLKEAYDNGAVVLTQSSSAGTVPHHVNVTNTGRDPVKLQVGDVLTSSSSQDLVVAENKTVKANSSDVVYAYCLDPSNRAVQGSNLTAGNTSSDAVKQVIYSSNIKDINNATDAQIQIWILTSGVNFNIYYGEPVAMVEKENLTYTKLRQMVSDAKNEIASRFKIKVDSIGSFNQNATNNSGSSVGGFLSWLKGI